jgi:predicted Zn-dependent protease
MNAYRRLAGHAAVLALGLTTLVAQSSPAPAPSPASSDDHAQEAAVSKKIYDDMQSQGQIVTDSVYSAILATVGRKISAAAAPHWFTERFVIVKGNQGNAFATPGGIVFVNEGLLRAVENADELANVLGHETAHLTLGHLTAREKTSNATSAVGKLGQWLSPYANNSVAQHAFDAASLSARYTFLNYSRQQEYAADQTGADIAAKAGYNPWGTVWFFNEAQRVEGDAGFEQYVQQHPSIKDRIARIEQYFKDNPDRFGRFSDRMTTTSGLPMNN